jgi:hypothetical protein
VRGGGGGGGGNAVGSAQRRRVPTHGTVVACAQRSPASTSVGNGSTSHLAAVAPSEPIQRVVTGTARETITATAVTDGRVRD